MRIYIAGPYTHGNPEENVNAAIDAADALWAKGHVPYCPHLTHFWERRHSHHWAEWLMLDYEWLRLCDALLRLPGESKGADREVTWTKEIGRPVYYSIDEIP